MVPSVKMISLLVVERTVSLPEKCVDIKTVEWGGQSV